MGFLDSDSDDSDDDSSSFGFARKKAAAAAATAASSPAKAAPETSTSFSDSDSDSDSSSGVVQPKAQAAAARAAATAAAAAKKQSFSDSSSESSVSNSIKRKALAPAAKQEDGSHDSSSSSTKASSSKQKKTSTTSSKSSNKSKSSNRTKSSNKSSRSSPQSVTAHPVVAASSVPPTAGEESPIQDDHDDKQQQQQQQSGEKNSAQQQAENEENDSKPDSKQGEQKGGDKVKLEVHQVPEERQQQEGGGKVEEESDSQSSSAPAAPAAANQPNQLHQPPQGDSQQMQEQSSQQPQQHEILEEEIEEEIVYEVIEEEIIEKEEAVPPPPPTDRIYRATSSGWGDVVSRVKQQHLREQRGALHVGYLEPHVSDMLEYNQWQDSALSVNQPNHVAHDYNETPWYDEHYEELPWHEQPDLDADDELTALCKKVLAAAEGEQGSEQHLQERAERVEAKVIGFALKLKNKWMRRKKQKAAAAAATGNSSLGTPGVPPPRPVTLQKSGSSLISGPESLGGNSSSSSSSSSRSSQRAKMGPRVSSLQKLGAATTPEGQLPKSMMDTNSSHRRWSVIDSGRKSSTLQQSPDSHVRQIRQARHSIAIVPNNGKSLSGLVSSLDLNNNSQHDRRRLSMIDSGYKRSPGRRSSLVDSKALLQLNQQLQSSPSPGEQPQSLPSLQPSREQGAPQPGPLPLPPTQQQQLLQQPARQKIHHVGATPTYRQHDVLTGQGNRYLQAAESTSAQLEWQQQPSEKRQQEQRQQRHCIATIPSRERPFNSFSNGSPTQEQPLRSAPPPLHQEVQEQPPVTIVDTSDGPLCSIHSHPSHALHRPNSRVSINGAGSSLVYSLNDDDDDDDQFSVPFDEPYGTEFFQDEYYYESKKKRGRLGMRTKLRRQSQDPPVSSRGMQRQRDPIQTINSFPPPELQSKIERAQAQQDRFAHNPTAVPGFFQAELADLELQWKAYSSRTSPTTSDDTVFTDDMLSPLSPLTDSLRHESSYDREGRELTEEERNHLRNVSRRSTISDDESDSDPVQHALNHLHDEDPAFQNKGSSWLESIWINIGGIALCCILLGIWIVVLILSLTNIGRPDDTQVQNGDSRNDSQYATLTAAPLNGTAVDLESLLPSYTYDAIQRKGDSPQWLAWEWLQTQDTESYSEEKLRQRFSLVTFYYAATGVESNTTNTTWIKPNVDECSWHEGIICNAEGTLTEVDLQKQELEGSIPPEIGLWTNLLGLDLGGNPQLQGSIPSTIGLLSDLLGLDFHKNALTGEIPSELGKLTNLRWLTLANQKGRSDMKISRNSDSGKLSSSLPTELGQLTKLEHMRLEDNRIEGPIPSELGNLQSLQTLVLRRNALTGFVPAQLGALVQLQGLALDFNQFGGRLPEEISQLTNLIEFHLSENALTGPLPKALSALSGSLTWLSLSGNAFTGTLPVAWSEISKLQVLQMEDNPGLTGTIPFEWGVNWPELQRVWLHETSLEGEVPLALCFLKDDPEYPLETIGVSCEDVICNCGCWCI